MDDVPLDKHVRSKLKLTGRIHIVYDVIYFASVCASRCCRGEQSTKLIDSVHALFGYGLREHKEVHHVVAGVRNAPDNPFG